MLKKKNFQILIITIIFSCLLINLVTFDESLAEENIFELYVGGSGDSNFSSIQSAVDQAKNGDTIYVYNGNYHENIIITKSVNLIGQDRNNTIIDGRSTGNVLSLKTNNINLSNFTIRNSGSNYSDDNILHAGVLLESNTCIISNCDLRENLIGLNIVNSNNNTIKNCKIFINNGGVNIIKSSYNKLYDCSIFNNDLLFGMVLQGSDYNDIQYCSVSSNKAIGLIIRESSFNQFYNNIFSNNTHGIRIFSSNTENCIFNKFYLNNFIGNEINAYDDCNNSWDNNLIGNYWDDYNGSDLDDNGVGDQDYMIPLISIDRYPLMDPLDLKENVSSNIIPGIIINITYPINNQKISGNITIIGESYYEEGDIKSIKIRIDDEKYKTANGTIQWVIDFDTTKYNNGFHTIYFFAETDTGYSKIENIEVNIDNKVNGEDDENNTPDFQLLSVCIAVIIIYILRFRKNM